MLWSSRESSDTMLAIPLRGPGLELCLNPYQRKAGRVHYPPCTSNMRRKRLTLCCPSVTFPIGRSSAVFDCNLRRSCYRLIVYYVSCDARFHFPALQTLRMRSKMQFLGRFLVKFLMKACVRHVPASWIAEIRVADWCDVCNINYWTQQHHKMTKAVLVKWESLRLH